MANSIEEYGYDAVGPGWKTILEVLDEQLKGHVAHAVQHATMVKPEYRDYECQADATLEILQIKEKFGGLRVYVNTKGVGTRIWGLIHGACRMAEGMSYKTCEKCGAAGFPSGEMGRPQPGFSYGRNLTLCEEHHKERDHCREEKIPFELGNGDKV